MYRILIADDEQSIRDGVAGYIENHCAGYEVVAKATNGEEALQLAQEFMPDVIITDIAMPRLNGLDFLESISSALPQTKMMVLSGFDDFEYARQAVRIGVTEYLLKPLETKQLEAALRKIRGELDLQGKQWELLENIYTKNELYQNSEFEEILQSLVLEGKDFRDENISANRGKFKKFKKFCCFVCTGDIERRVLTQLLMRQFWRTAATVAVFLLSEKKKAIVFCSHTENAHDLFIEIHRGLTVVATRLKRENKTPLKFFIGSIVSDPEKLSISFNQAQETSEYMFEDDQTLISHYDELRIHQRELFRFPEEEERRFLQAVAVGNETVMQQEIECLFKWFRDNGIADASFIRLYSLELCTKLLDSVKNLKAHMTFYEFTKLYNEILFNKHIHGLKESLLNFTRIINYKKHYLEAEDENKVSDKVKELVEQNLSDPEFDLDDVAGQVFLSPNYLRQLFKRETGMTFIEYLTNERMEYAKRLLGKGNAKVGDVAEKVGYLDSRYFSVSFKKRFGQTPSEYQMSVQI